MKPEFSYEWLTDNLHQYLKMSDGKNPNLARSWLYRFDVDVPLISEAERLNFMLTVIVWEVQHDCVSKTVEDELYLYYEQLVKGELDDIISQEEREEVVRDLTNCFNKVFPEGLEENGEL